MSSQVDLADEILAAARLLIERPVPEMAGLWPRACAFLTRQALELAVCSFLDARVPGTSASSFRAQLLCLPELARGDVGHDAAYLWFALSRACHHHPYELAPTYAELEEWLAGAERVASTLAARATGSATAAE